MSFDDDKKVPLEDSADVLDSARFFQTSPQGDENSPLTLQSQAKGASAECHRTIVHVDLSDSDNEDGEELHPILELTGTLTFPSSPSSRPFFFWNIHICRLY